FDTDRGAWIMPTTTPVQFQPDALRRSIARIVDLAPAHLALTHFGRVGDVARLATLFLGQLDAMVDLARSLGPGIDRHQALKEGLAEIHLRSLREHGVTAAESHLRQLLALDLELNAQGIAIWLARTRR